MDMTKKGDFLLVESADRRFLNPMYRIMTVAGRTVDKQGLLQMATKIKQNRAGYSNAKKITSIKEAILTVECGGWVVLEFLN